MAALSELTIINTIYALYETDDAGWDSTSSEYVTAREYINAAVKDWASRDTWRDLWTTLTASTQTVPTLVKTTTAGTYAYTCPTDFAYPNSWVRTTDGSNNTFWSVVTPEFAAKYASDYSYYVYFTGSVKAGYVLNFNPRITLTTGHTINYEYYKTPTVYSGTTSTSEIPDPYYCVYYALARFLRNDGEDFSYEEGKAREIMDSMLTRNQQGYWDISNAIDEPLNMGAGFGN